MSKMIEVDLVNFINYTVSGVGIKPEIKVDVKREGDIFTFLYKDETYSFYVKVYEEESSYGDYQYAGWAFVKPVKKEVTVWE